MGWFDSFIISPDALRPQNEGIYDNKPQTVSAAGDAICQNYTLEVKDECAANLDQVQFKTINIQADVFDNYELDEIIKETENGDGENRRVIYIQKRWIQIPILTSSYHRAILDSYQGFSDFLLTNIDSGEEMECDRCEVVTAAIVKDNIAPATLRLRIKEAAIVTTDQCGSMYENAPFEGCDENDEGTPGGDPNCDGYSLSGSDSGTAMTVSTTDGPETGTETFRWRYRANENEGWSVLSNDTNSYSYAENYGQYEVVAFKGSCQTDPYIFTIVDPCDGFAASLTLDAAGYLIAEITRVPDTIEWYLDTGSGYTLDHSGGYIHLPEVSGNWKVKAISGDCEDESDTVEVEVSDCDFTLSITKNPNGSLTAVISGYSGSDTPAFKWEKETAAGIVSSYGGTGDTIVPDEQAIYHAYVELDDCEKSTYALVLSECIAFQAYIESITPGTSSYTLTGATINAPGPVNIEWFQYTGGAYVSIGTGNSVVTTQVGHVKMVAKSGSCVKEDYTEIAMDFDDPYYYQKFILTGGESAVTVTEFTLPDIVNEHPDRIAYLMEVVQNGVEQVYDHEEVPGSLQRLHFSIDGQDVQFNPAYSRAGSIIVVKMKKV